MTLVEVLIAASILGLAIAPVVGILTNSFRQIRNEKMEATAANFAGKLLNVMLFQMKFDEVVNFDGSKADDPQGRLDGVAEGANAIDGTALEWRTELRVVGDPLSGRGPKFWFTQADSGLHRGGGHPGGETVDINGADTNLATDPGTSNKFFHWDLRKVDSKYINTGNSSRDIPVLVDIKLTIRWKGPGEDFNEERKQMLYTRKARLE